MAAGSCWDWQEIWESSRLRSPEAQRMAVSRCGPCREECFGKKMGGFSHPRTPEPLLLCMENGCRTLLGGGRGSSSARQSPAPKGRRAKPPERVNLIHPTLQLLLQLPSGLPNAAHDLPAHRGIFRAGCGLGRSQCCGTVASRHHSENAPSRAFISIQPVAAAPRCVWHGAQTTWACFPWHPTAYRLLGREGTT